MLGQWIVKPGTQKRTYRVGEIGHDGSAAVHAVENWHSHLLDEEHRLMQVVKVGSLHLRPQIRGGNSPSSVDGDDDIGQGANAGRRPAGLVHAGLVVRPQHVEIELFGIAPGLEHGRFDASGGLVVRAVENVPQDVSVAVMHVRCGASVLAVVFEIAVANHWREGLALLGWPWGVGGWLLTLLKVGAWVHLLPVWGEVLERKGRRVDARRRRAHRLALPLTHSCGGEETEKKRDITRRGGMAMIVCESGETTPQRKWSDAISYTLYVLVRSHPGCISKRSTWRSAQAAG
jgi:hypothetical protein